MTRPSPVSATCRSSTSINRQKNKRKHRSPRGIFPPRPLRRMRLRSPPAKKKKFPGWATALICAAVVLLAVLVLNFAGTAAFTVLRTGERYIYDHAGAYETLGRSGFGSEQVMADIDEIEIHWLSGSVYLVESETDGVTFQEDYTGDVDDYRLRYAVEDGKLVIQPCRSRTFGSMDLPKKTLTVFLPKTRTLDAITVETVSADVELHGGQTSDLSVTTTSGEIIGPGIRAGEYDLSTVSGGRPPAIAPGGGQQHRLRYRLGLYEPWLRGLPRRTWTLTASAAA